MLAGRRLPNLYDQATNENRKESAVSPTGRVLVYNHGGSEVLGVVPMKHAITMLWRRVARIRAVVEGPKIGPYDRPKALELLKKVAHSVVTSTTKVPYSKTALWIRENGLCGYCGKPGRTMDHIHPKSRGGPATWLNAVNACSDCNEKKADRTPEEAGMPLLVTPYEPTWLELFSDETSPRVSHS